MKTQPLLALACVAAAFSVDVQAMDLAPRGVFAIAGAAAHGTHSVSVGAIWPWAWRKQAASGELTAITEAYVSYWRGRAAAGHQAFTQIGVVPIFRYRPEQGRSAWFGEGGIGISTMDRLYNTPDKEFSTRFNFVDAIGVGRSFGARRQQELDLRVLHVSNASIKRPNPGENFLQLRYAVMF